MNSDTLIVCNGVILPFYLLEICFGKGELYRKANREEQFRYGIVNKADF